MSNFTLPEKIAMWKFAMENNSECGKWQMWNKFVKQTGSKRSVHSLYFRFMQSMLPSLPQTKFHVETKLKLCQKYNVKIDDDFLKGLEEEADVQLDENREVVSYQLKPNCPENRDMELNDEEFGEILSTPTKIPWSFEEKAEFWKYLLNSDDTSYSPKSLIFWKGLMGKLNNRTLESLRKKFREFAPEIHKTDFSIEQKLKLYKKCRIAVDEKYLKRLKKHADLKVNENGCIIDYNLKTDRPEKRKNSDVADERAKKMRRADPDDQEEDDDLVFDGVVTAVNRKAERTRRDRPGTSSDEWGEIEDVKLGLVSDRYRIPAKTEEDELMFHQIFEGSAETEQEDVTVTAVVRPKEEVVEHYEAAVHKEEQFVQVEQRRDNQSALIAEMFKMIKRMEKANENQRDKFNKFENHVKNLETSVEEMKNEIKIMRNELSNSLPEDPTASNKKNYLLKLKQQASLLESPEMDEIANKIDTLLEKCSDNDESPLPTNLLIGNFINQLAALGN